MAGQLAQIWDAIKACFPVSGQPLTMAQILAWIGNSYPDAGFHPATVKTQVHGSCANVPSAHVYRKNTPKILFFDKSNRTYRLRDSNQPDAGTDAPLIPGESGPEFEDHENVESGKGSTFAMEAHLRDYLAINLHELGLRPRDDEPAKGGESPDSEAADSRIATYHITRSEY